MSLRRFIEVCSKAGDVYKVPYPCDPEYQVAAHIRKSCDEEGPLLTFESEGLTEVPIVGSVYGTPGRIKRILDPEYGSKYCDLTDIAAVKRYVSCADVAENDVLSRFSQEVDNAPCQEIVLKGGDVNLDLIPICTHNELDKGPFVTAGVNIVRWIDGVTLGLGIHRMCKINKTQLSCLAPPNRRVGFPHYKSDKGVKMAVAIGAPPEVVLASQAKLNQRTDKYVVASNLQGGSPVKLAKCVTSDLLVPACSEMILECTTVPKSNYNDTPFGEYPGTYSLRSNAFVVTVDAITYRKNFIYQTILTGQVPQEDSNLCAIPYSAEVYRAASNLVEEVTDIAAFIGNNVFDTIVCIKKNSNAEVENLMHLLLGNKYIKSVTIMDHDLQASQSDWRFAFNTRYQPNRNTIITNLGLGASLDPSSPLFQTTSKIAMDFTVPIGTTPEMTEANWKRHRVARTHPSAIVTCNF